MFSGLQLKAITIRTAMQAVKSAILQQVKIRATGPAGMRIGEFKGGPEGIGSRYRGRRRRADMRMN
jgi:hypothetical protein